MTVNSYMKFVKRMRPMLEMEYPSLKGRDMLKKLAEVWGALTEEEQDEYEAGGTTASATTSSTSASSADVTAIPEEVEEVDVQTAVAYVRFINETQPEMEKIYKGVDTATILQLMNDAWKKMPQEDREEYMSM